jgi:AcrR family transcriptional regulator
MPERPEPRKLPTTRVAHDITDAILTAAEGLIETAGLAGFTTNAVAERAGVSVGSLYQYFPNKDAILVELGRRLERRTQEQLIAALEATSGEPLEVAAGAVVDVLVTGIGGLRFRRALQQAVPPGWIDETANAVDGAIRLRLETELSRRGDVRDGRRALMCLVVAHAIEGAVEAVVRTTPDVLGDAALRDELVLLVTRYLRG